VAERQGGGEELIRRLGSGSCDTEAAGNDANPHRGADSPTGRRRLPCDAYAVEPRTQGRLRCAVD
jgi:hypothetical protein